jgi:aspartokinase
MKHEDCTMIVVHSPEELEVTPGVVAFLATLLAEQNVNIIEFISCWTETIMVVDKKDSLKAYEVLSNMVLTKTCNEVNHNLNNNCTWIVSSDLREDLCR